MLSTLIDTPAALSLEGKFLGDILEQTRHIHGSTPQVEGAGIQAGQVQQVEHQTMHLPGFIIYHLGSLLRASGVFAVPSRMACEIPGRR